MLLRNKKTGEIVDYLCAIQGDDIKLWSATNNYEAYHYKRIAEFTNEWEDYEPIEPIFDEKIRRGIRAWWDMQDNPFKSASVYCDKKKDLDGFYHWRIFGYIREGEQKESTDLCFRTKKLYEFKYFKDYTKQELCGEEKLNG